MKKALINIDYTVDFVADDGALTCGKPGQEIEDEIVRLTEKFIREGELVAFTIDLHHDKDDFHPESKLFPPHNIKDTHGRKLYGKLQAVYEQNQEKENVLWIDKTRYNAFTGTDLELKLRERGITDLHLVGVCSDICVLHTAIAAFEKGFDVTIHEKAVASFDEEGHRFALRHFKNTLGARVE